MRLAILAMLFVAPAVRADAPLMMAARLEPGTYQGPGYVTRFDSGGRWLTTQGSSQAGGNYMVDGDAITFTAQPAGCAQEQVRYRFTATPDGFRLHMIQDSCGRFQQIPDLVFVRKAR